MSPARALLALSLLTPAIVVSPLQAQRQMETLGRGVVAVRSSNTEVYVGWRLLGDEPTDLGFHVYRSVNGATPVRVTSTPITTSTNFLDAPGSGALASPISYSIAAVVNGVEQPRSAAFTLPANSAWPSTNQRTLPSMVLPLSTPTPNPSSPSPYDVKFCWVGDFDGDGEYDFLVDRVPTSGEDRQYLEAYKRDGTFLWRMDLGPNSVAQSNIYEPGSSVISVGDTDNVTVYDLDGDGRAEVAVRTANGVTVTNAAGEVVATVTAANNTTQFASIFDGLSGAELARTTLPNPWAQHGTLTNKCAVAYLDGVRPSVIFYGYNRANTGEFYRVFSAFDYRDGEVSLRWSTPQTFPGAEGHQIRIADVDNDGKDEIIDIGHVIDDDGTQLFHIAEISHGDRFHVADIDPDRPGLENFVIQQNNPTMLATAYYDAGSGEMIKKWYATSVVDVGRGIALDINSAHKGYEFYSTQPGIFNAKGEQIYANNVWAPEGLWWDGDLLREFIDGPNNGATSPVINKFNQVSGNSDRMWNLYSSGVHQAYGGRPAFWGDILGDWREEVVVVSSDYSSLRIFTTHHLTTERLYTLMHNPAYRTQATTKGYVQASNVDYYLGAGMTPPPPPPMVKARLAWSGGAGANTWGVGSAPAWTDTASSAPAGYADGDTVRFDISGDGAQPVLLSGTLAPGEVTVYSPHDYTFDGTAGSLAGAMKLVKAGRGTLRVTGTHTFTGATTVWDGALRVDGTLSGSPLTIWGGTWGGPLARGKTGGRLSGTGTVAQSVALRYRGAITPGAGVDSAGTLTIGALSAEDGSTLAFDLSTDPTGTTLANDRLVVDGDLSLSGKVTVHINPLSGELTPGSYTLLTYTGALIGSLSNLSIVVPEGTPHSVSLAGGALTLTIPTTRPAGSVTWTGSVNGVWDLATTSNWQLGGSPAVFVAGDTVTFNDTGASRPAITIGVSVPVGGVNFGGSTNYTINGGGSITGPGGLTKSGSGTVTINTTNSFTGPVSITGGKLAVANLADGGLPSSIGASSAIASNFVINGGTLRVAGTQTNTNRSITLGASGGTIENSVTLQISGSLTGPGSLTKTGNGTLILANANTHAGGVVVQSGTLVLASDEANTNGIGSGALTLQGGTLRMYNNFNSYNTSSWPIVVPAGAHARFEADGRSYLTGSLTGSGTLEFFTPYVRTDINGNWSAFSGTINVVTDNDGGDFRFGNTAGLPSATVNLAPNTWTYSIVNSSHTFAIGALSGSGAITGNSNTSRVTTWRIGAKNLDTTYAGVISGNSALEKVGTGTLTLTGASTYAGATTVSAGKLLLSGGSLSGAGVTVATGAGFGGAGTVNGNVTFQNGSTFLSSPGAPLAINGNLSLSGTILVAPPPGVTPAPGTYTLYTCTGTVSGTPTFVWAGPDYTLTLNTSVPGTVTYTLTQTAIRPAADLTWTGADSALWNNVDLNWTDGDDTIAFQDNDHVRFDDSSSVLDITIDGSPGPASVTVDSSKNYRFSGGSIVGSGGLTKSGAGALTLASVQAYSGGTTLAGGMLELAAGGGIAGPVAVEGVATFRMSAPGTNFPGNALELAGGATLTLASANLANGYSGLVSGPANTTLALSGPISFSATGVAQLGAFHGTVTIPAGSQLRFSSTSGANGNGGADATFVVDGLVNTRNASGAGGVVLGALSGSGRLEGQTNTAVGTVTYVVGAKGVDTTFSGVIANGANGAAALHKVGAARLRLDGDNTYTGATTVSAGELLVTGSLGATAVSVANGATFGGTGTLGGNLTLASGARLALGVTSSAIRGPTVAGTTTLNGAITVVPGRLGGELAPGTYPLLTYSGTLAGSPSFTWLDTLDSGYTATFSTATPGVVTITLVAPPGPLDNWRDQYFGTTTPEGDAADTADPDGDGFPNLLEYALGGHPTQSSSGLVTLEVADADTPDARLSLAFQRIADPSLTYRVQASADLSDWQDIWVSTGAANVAGPVVVTDSEPLAETPRRFLRLKVSR